MLSMGGLTIRGQLLADEDVRIEGSFEGTIEVRGHDLVTGEGSRIDAAVSARSVRVLGRVDGNIQADVVELGPSARVQANVLAKQLAVADGAQFNGAVNTERARAAIEVARRRASVQPGSVPSAG